MKKKIDGVFVFYRCWTGNIFGVGALRQPVGDTDHIGCWCCRPHIVTARSRIDDGQISYVRYLSFYHKRKRVVLKPRMILIIISRISSRTLKRHHVSVTFRK